MEVELNKLLLRDAHPHPVPSPTIKYVHVLFILWRRHPEAQRKSDTLELRISSHRILSLSASFSEGAARGGVTLLGVLPLEQVIQTGTRTVHWLRVVVIAMEVIMRPPSLCGLAAVGDDRLRDAMTFTRLKVDGAMHDDRKVILSGIDAMLALFITTVLFRSLGRAASFLLVTFSLSFQLSLWGRLNDPDIPRGARQVHTALLAVFLMGNLL